MSKKYSRYKLVFAEKSRKYNIRHIKKGAPRKYRYECRLAHMHLIKSAGYKSNNWMKMHHEPMRRKIPVVNIMDRISC